MGVLGELNVRDFSKFKVVGSANIWVADSKYELMEHTPSRTWVAAKGELLYGSDESAPIVAKVEKQCHAIVSPFVVAFYGVHFGGQDSDGERCRGGRCACCSYIHNIEGLRDQEGCVSKPQNSPFIRRVPTRQHARPAGDGNGSRCLLIDDANNEHQACRCVFVRVHGRWFTARPDSANRPC